MSNGVNNARFLNWPFYSIMHERLTYEGLCTKAFRELLNSRWHLQNSTSRNPGSQITWNRLQIQQANVLPSYTSQVFFCSLKGAIIPAKKDFRAEYHLFFSFCDFYGILADFKSSWKYHYHKRTLTEVNEKQVPGNLI